MTAPGEKDKAESKHAKFYNELWFAVLMVVLGLILLAILLSLILQRKVRKQPYARDRPPLVPLQKRTSPMSVYSSGETHPVRLEKCSQCISMKPSPSDTHTDFFFLLPTFYCTFGYQMEAVQCRERTVWSHMGHICVGTQSKVC